MSQLLRRLIVLQPGEAPALLASFATLLCMFSSYTILRRCAMPSASPRAGEHPYLFWGVFVVMLLLQPLYAGSLRASRAPCSCRGCTVSSPPTAHLLGVVPRTDGPYWIARSYFVWVSVFNLFVVAAFWSLMATCSAVSRRGACSASSGRAPAPAG